MWLFNESNKKIYIKFKYHTLLISGNCNILIASLIIKILL